MTNRVLAVLSMTIGFVTVSGPLFAHHSGSSYDDKHPITMTGTVTQFEFTNPHIIIRLAAKDATGSVEQWSAIGGAPASLSHDKRLAAYWNRDTFKPGDQITITGNPHRDGRKFLTVKKIVTSSGEVVPLGPEQ